MRKYSLFIKCFHKLSSLVSWFLRIFIRIEESIIKKILLRKENKNFLYEFIKENPLYLPSSSIQIVNLISSRYRKVMKTDLSNRVKPTRWKTINSKIQNIIKKYNLTPTKFLNVGAGKKNPYALPILWYLNRAQKIEIIEPDEIDNISAISGVQELYWDLQCKKGINQNKKKNISDVLHEENLLIGKDINKIINKNVMNLQNTSVEKSKLKKNYFDFIYSRSTLEHLVNVEEVLSKLYFCQKYEGISYHEIDFTGHDVNNKFWIYSYEWELDKGSVSNLNGWRLSDYTNFYKKLGAKVIIINKILESQNLLNKDTINKKFKRYSLDELRVSSASLIILKETKR